MQIWWLILFQFFFSYFLQLSSAAVSLIVIIDLWLILNYVVMELYYIFNITQLGGKHTLIENPIDI